MTAAVCILAGEVHEGLPTYPWGSAPAGLATRRQLSAAGLRPGGQEPVAQMLRPRQRRDPLTAYLYDVALAKPKRTLTPALLAAVRTAARSRQICVQCGRTGLGYIPRQAAPCYGRCWDCMGLPAVNGPVEAST